MSVDQTNKPVKIFDNDTELERAIFNERKDLARAILDDRMEPFRAEIEAKLAGFGHHKEQLLRHLRDVNNRGPKMESFDEAKSWFLIETTAYQYFALQIMKQTMLTAADREVRYRAISDAAKRAMKMIEEARKHPDLGSDLIKAWLEGNKEFPEATEQFGGRLYIEIEFRREFEKAIASLTELEALATNKAANELHKGPGRPKGTAVLPWNYIVQLAWDYRKTAAKRPGTGEGPFARFVREFLTAIGQIDNISDQYVIDAIQDARDKAREKYKTSPFDD